MCLCAYVIFCLFGPYVLLFILITHLLCTVTICHVSAYRAISSPAHWCCRAYTWDSFARRYRIVCSAIRVTCFATPLLVYTCRRKSTRPIREIASTSRVEAASSLKRQKGVWVNRSHCDRQFATLRGGMETMKDLEGQMDCYDELEELVRKTLDFQGLKR